MKTLKFYHDLDKVKDLDALKEKLKEAKNMCEPHSELRYHLLDLIDTIDLYQDEHKDSQEWTKQISHQMGEMFLPPKGFQFK